MIDTLAGKVKESPLVDSETLSMTAIIGQYMKAQGQTNTFRIIKRTTIEEVLADV